MSAQRNSLTGKISFVIGILALSAVVVLFLIGAIISLANYDEGIAFGKIAMTLGVIATPVSLIGLTLGIIGIWSSGERRKISIIGTVLNAVFVFGAACVFIYAAISVMRSAGH